MGIAPKRGVALGFNFQGELNKIMIKSSISIASKTTNGEVIKWTATVLMRLVRQDKE